jgi:RHS repeat-associated protein
MGTNKGYTGQYADPLTGFDYYNARYYDPVSGVFLSADCTQGNMQGMNPYAYVGANPETNTDPTGEMYAPPGGSGGNGLTTPSPPPAPSCNWWCWAQQQWNGIVQTYQNTWNSTVNDYKAAWSDEVHFAQQTQETITRTVSQGISVAHIVIGVIVAAAIGVGGYLIWRYTHPRAWFNLKANEGQIHYWNYQNGVGPNKSEIHVYKYHIGKSQTFLLSRATAINKSATSYTNAKIAQWAVDYALSTMNAAEKSQLNNMIANPRAGGTLVLRRTVSQSVGYGYKYNRSTGTFTWVASTNTYQVTIRVDVNTGVPFIVTSYPTV